MEWSVVTARYPQYSGIETFDNGSMRVRLFATREEAVEWAMMNPEYITEVVEVEQ